MSDEPNDGYETMGESLPKLAGAWPLEERLARVRFADGREKVVDLAAVLASRRIFIPLREDDALFRSLKISEFGDAIEWEGGIELSALWIDRLPASVMSNEEFRAIMQKLGLSLDGLALTLDLSRRQIANYRGERPIPRHVALAMRYLSEYRRAS